MNGLVDNFVFLGKVQVKEFIPIGNDFGPFCIDMEKTVCKSIGVGVLRDQADKLLLGDVADNGDMAIGGLKELVVLRAVPNGSIVQRTCVPSFTDDTSNGATCPLGRIKHAGELRKVKQATTVTLRPIAHLSGETFS